MKRFSSLESRPISMGGFRFLFFLLLSSIFVHGFFPGVPMMSAEALRENPVSTINLIRVSLIGLAGLFTLAILLVRAERVARNVAAPLAWMMVYGTVAFASAAYSSSPLLSAGQGLEVLVDVLFFAIVSCLCTAGEVVSLWSLFLLYQCGLLAAVWVSALVAPSVGFHHFPGALLPLQLQGAFPVISATDLGGMSAIVAATAFYRMMLRRRSALGNEGLLWAGVFVFGVVSLIFAQVRTSMIGFGAALLVTLFMTRRLNLLPILAICVGTILASGGGDTLREYYMKGQGVDALYSLTGRLTIWDAAWNYYKQSPFLGHGFLTAHRLDLVVGNYRGFSTVENTFLDVLLGIGIVGLIPFVMALLSLVVRFWHISPTGGAVGRLREAKCEMAGALVIVFVRATTGTTFDDHTMSLFVLLITMAFAATLFRRSAEIRAAAWARRHVALRPQFETSS